MGRFPNIRTSSPCSTPRTRHQAAMHRDGAVQRRHDRRAAASGTVRCRWRPCSISVSRSPARCRPLTTAACCIVTSSRNNLFISEFGEPALGDFGISTLDDERTISGGGGLTVHYAPPEVLEGSSASPSSDVYSFAATLYTLLEGARPFATGRTAPTSRSANWPGESCWKHRAAPSAPTRRERSGICWCAPGQDRRNRRRRSSAAEFGRQLQHVQGELRLAAGPAADQGAERGQRSHCGVGRCAPRSGGRRRCGRRLGRRRPLRWRHGDDRPTRSCRLLRKSSRSVTSPHGGLSSAPALGSAPWP